MESAINIVGASCGGSPVSAGAAAKVVITPGISAALPHSNDGLSAVWGHRRALIGNAAAAGAMAAALGFTIRRGRALGFRKLFHSVSAPKDIVYIGALYGLGDCSQQLITQARK